MDPSTKLRDRRLRDHFDRDRKQGRIQSQTNIFKEGEIAKESNVQKMQNAVSYKPLKFSTNSNPNILLILFILKILIHV